MAPVAELTRQGAGIQAAIAIDDKGRGYPLLKFLNGYYMPMQDIDDIVRDTDEGPGWTILFDADRCPSRYLPWLAMFAGVRINRSMTDQQIRERIKDRPAWRRGTPAGIKQAAQSKLTGAKKVILRERHQIGNPDDAPGYFELITYTDETPDSAAVLRTVVDEQKDVGLLIGYRVLDGQDWDQVVADWDSWDDVMSNYDTWTDVIEDTPV